MKKYVLIGIMMAIVPSICFGQSARFTNLVREKERKMAELEKCMGTTNGLKIAGLSTLGLTAVGVAGNIYEAQKINEYDTQTQKVEKKIESVQKDIDKKTEEIAEKAAKAKADAGKKTIDGTSVESNNQQNNQNGSTVVNGMNIRDAVRSDIERLRNFEPAGVQSTIQLSGYKFCEVPSDLQPSLGVEIEAAKKKCTNNDMVFTYNNTTYFSESCDKKDVVSSAGQVIAKCVKEVSVDEALDSSTGGGRSTDNVSNNSLKQEEVNEHVPGMLVQPALDNTSGLETRSINIPSGVTEGGTEDRNNGSKAVNNNNGNASKSNPSTPATKQAAGSSKKSSTSVSNDTERKTIDLSKNGLSITSDSQNNEWSVSFDWGTIIGRSLCSGPQLNVGKGDYGTPDETKKGTYCWCIRDRLTYYQAKYDKVVLRQKQWVYVEPYSYNRGEARFNCSASCAEKCATEVQTNENIRSKIAGINEISK